MGDNRGVCRVYANQGRCRFGAKCKFSHYTPANATSSPSPHSRHTPASSSSSGPSNRRGGHGTQASRPPPQTGPASNVPRNVCRIFWGTGSCDRLFDCSFQHVKGSAASATTSNTIDAGIEEPPDFFSSEGLAVNSGATRLALDPSTAHNNILLFLKDNYRFENASKMQGFINVVASVNDRNKLWVSSRSLAPPYDPM